VQIEIVFCVATCAKSDVKPLMGVALLLVLLGSSPTIARAARQKFQAENARALARQKVNPGHFASLRAPRAHYIADRGAFD
jgi:hypothetical protein